MTRTIDGDENDANGAAVSGGDSGIQVLWKPTSPLVLKIVTSDEKPFHIYR